MAVLPNVTRRKAYAAFQRLPGSVPGNLTKGQGRNAFDAADDWLDAQHATMVAALPPAWRNNAADAQTLRLISAVAMARANMLTLAEGD